MSYCAERPGEFPVRASNNGMGASHREPNRELPPFDAMEAAFGFKRVVRSR